DAFFAIMDAQTQKRLDQVDEETKSQLDAIDKQLENEELTEEKREKLEAKRTELEEEADAERKKIEEEAAQRKLAIANFEVLINGGVAVTKALSVDPTGILAAFVAAQVFAELALINAAQIPAFAKGTNYSPEGMALVGEKGPEVVYLPRGSKVKTAAESKRIMNQPLDNRAITEMMNHEIQRQIHLKYDQNVTNKFSQSMSDRNLIKSDSQTREVLYEMTDRIVDELRSQNASRGTI
ncbi:unnamed protein product, partial [marine sediment metagenome]